MSSSFTITVSDEITLWLREKATELNVDVEALVAEIVEDVAAQTAKLAWQERLTCSGASTASRRGPVA